MKKALRCLLALMALLVLTGLYGGNPWPSGGASNDYHVRAFGISGTAASDRTLQALGNLSFPLGIPDDANVFYVSVSDGGWYRAGNVKATGTQMDPLGRMQDMQTVLDRAAGPIVFLFDPGDIYIQNATDQRQFISEPQESASCGDTGETCWVFASADLTGVQMPTFSCGDGSTVPTGDGFITNDSSDAMAFVNLRFSCPTVPNEDLKPVFYNDGIMYFLNVVADGIVGSGNVFYQGVAGSQAVGVGVSGTTLDGHDFDDICTALNTPYECCTATPDCDGSDPLFFKITGGSHIFIGGTFDYPQTADSANTPRISFGEFSGGDTRFYGTGFRYPYLPLDQDTLKWAIYMSDTASVTHTHGFITNDYNNDSNDDSAYYFEPNDADQSVDLRLFRVTNNAMERNINAPDLIDSAGNTLWARCVLWDETDVSKDLTCYDVYMDDTSGDGSLDGSELTLDVQNSVFDDECTTTQFYYDGTSDNEIVTFRTTAADAITSYFGTAHHATVGTEGSRDCGDIGNGFCLVDGYRQTASCGGVNDIGDCQGLCSTSLNESLPITVPELFLGDGADFSSFSFNSARNQNIGGGP
jgi:hypothetical protein